MGLKAKLGARIDPENPDSPTVSEVLINKTEDSDMCVVIVRASNGKWFADYDDGPEVIVADSAQELAAHLWRSGECNIWVAEALFRIGWLTLDVMNLKLADLINWRQPDPLGDS